MTQCGCSYPFLREKKKKKKKKGKTKKQSHAHNREILLQVSITRCDYTSVPIGWIA